VGRLRQKPRGPVSDAATQLGSRAGRGHANGKKSPFMEYSAAMSGAGRLNAGH
jgi:hypothetical protein